MEMRDALLLGAVQGLTEFLPVSSSAHLALLRRLTGHADAPRAFDVALHLATTAALIPATHRQVIPPGLSLLEDIARRRTAVTRYRSQSRDALMIALATLPAIAVGALFHDPIERWGRRPERIALALLLGSAWLGAAEACARATRPHDSSDLTAPVAVALGIAQAVALVPGISRSGATIATGLLLGLGPDAATRASFQLAVPVTLAAAARVVPEIGRFTRTGGARPLAGAGVAAFVTSLAGIALLRRVLARWGPAPFIVYRCLLAAALLALAGRDRR
jgi:undecaprenyl-diphosphatase